MRLRDTELRALCALHAPKFSEVTQGGDYTDEEREFLAAVDDYKRVNRRPYSTWREVLAVIHALGYRRADVDEEGRVQAPAPDRESFQE